MRRRFCLTVVALGIFLLYTEGHPSGSWGRPPALTTARLRGVSAMAVENFITDNLARDDTVTVEHRLNRVEAIMAAL